MQNLSNAIVSTVLTVIGTGTFGAICFAFYTVITM